MSFKNEVKKFVEEFGFYILILFFTLILYTLSYFLPQQQISFKKLSIQMLALEQLLQDKLIRISQNRYAGYENIPFLIAGFIVTVIVFVSLFLFLFQIYKLFKGRPLVIKSKFSPLPLWNLKDFSKILVWILFWIEFIALMEQLYKVGVKSISQKQNFLISLSSSLIFDAIVLILLIYWLRRYYRQNLLALGIYKNRFFLDFKLAFFYYLSFLPLLFILTYVSGIYFQKYQSTGGYRVLFSILLLEKNPLILGVVVLFIVFFGPVVEEIFFRGLLYNSLKKSLGVFQAMLVSSILFSLLHMNLMGFLPILALSLLFVYLYEKTGSLLISIFVHILHNGSLVSLIFLMRIFLKI